MKKITISILSVLMLLLTGCVNEERMESKQVSIISKTLLEEKEDIENTEIKMVEKDIYKVTFSDGQSRYYYFEYPVGRLLVESRYELNNYKIKK